MDDNIRTHRNDHMARVALESDIAPTRRAWHAKGSQKREPEPLAPHVVFQVVCLRDTSETTRLDNGRWVHPSISRPSVPWGSDQRVKSALPNPPEDRGPLGKRVSAGMRPELGTERRKTPRDRLAPTTHRER